MNMGKTVLAQRTLIRFCREHGYTDMKFIGVDCVLAVDPNVKQQLLSVDLEGNVITLCDEEIIN